MKYLHYADLMNAHAGHAHLCSVEGWSSGKGGLASSSSDVEELSIDNIVLWECLVCKGWDQGCSPWEQIPMNSRGFICLESAVKAF